MWKGVSVAALVMFELGCGSDGSPSDPRLERTAPAIRNVGAGDVPLNLFLPTLANTAQFQGNRSGHQVGSGLQLTSGTSDDLGSSLFRQRAALPDDYSFSLFFRMHVADGGGVALTGDGMCFMLQTDGVFALGNPGGGMGCGGVPNSFETEFDDFDDGGDDPDDHHIATHLEGDVDSHLGRASIPGAWTDGTFGIWIDYDGANQLLEIREALNSDVRPTTPLISHPVDLAQHFGGQKPWAGFTAATGGAYASHWVDGLYMAYGYAPIDVTQHTYFAVPTRVTVASSPSNAGHGSVLTVAAIDSDSSPHADWPVDLTTDSGTLGAGRVMTDASGVATVTLTSATTLDGTAHVVADAGGGATDSADVSLLGNPSVLASAASHGAITPAGSVMVPYGEGQRFVIQAMPGFRVHDVQVDGASRGPLSEFTFSNVTAPHRIAASFARGPLRVVTGCNASGSASLGWSVAYCLISLGWRRPGRLRKSATFTGESR